tara:strand:+ start:552 stop:791 length:240 start_codon:yes stop_codon:yes gene_type:complete
MATNTRSDELDAAIQEFLDNGGEITNLKYATEKMQNKARAIAHHRDRALNGSERSKDVIERERVREGSMVFSRIDRMKK